jgi:hypothetical protein
MSRQFVALLHTLADGSSHFDWMFEGVPGGALRTFRVACSPVDAIGRGAVEAKPLGDHRREYLVFEGPIAGDRGSVVRVFGATLTEYIANEDDFVAIFEHGGGVLTCTGVQLSPPPDELWAIVTVRTDELGT